MESLRFLGLGGAQNTSNILERNAKDNGHYMETGSLLGLMEVISKIIQGLRAAGGARTPTIAKPRGNRYYENI